MLELLIILALIACAVLAFFILIQKPKGGGLSGTFGSIGSQVMGVKQSGDVMEKGTWYTMAIIAILSIATTFLIPVSKAEAPAKATTGQQSESGQGQQQQTPAQ